MFFYHIASMNNEKKEKKIKSFQFITTRKIEKDDEWKKKTISALKGLIDLKKYFQCAPFHNMFSKKFFVFMLTVK